MDKIASELSKLYFLKELDNLKGEIEDFKPFPKEVEDRVMQKFRLEWNYHSNAIEGNSLTYGETVSFLMYGLTAKGKPLKDHLDIRGHNEAIKFLLSIVKDEREITESDIRALHETILVEPYEVDAVTPDGKPTKRWITLGNYKTVPNSVKTRTGEMHYYASVEETPALMKDLMVFYINAIKDPKIHPLVLAAIFHHRFVAIHPFDDGNGRMARILSNLILMRNDLPPIVIRKDDVERDKYYQVLSQADTGELIPLIEFFAAQLKRSLEIYLKALKGESIDEPSDIDKEIALFKAEIREKVDVEIRKSNEVILPVIEQFAIPFFTYCSEKINKLKELFFEFENQFYVNNAGLDIPASDAKSMISFVNTYMKAKRIDSYQMNCKFVKFKNSQNAFDSSIILRVMFHEYIYKIDFIIIDKDDFFKELFSKYYHELPSKTEIEGAINICMKAIMEDIKNKNNSLN